MTWDGAITTLEAHMVAAGTGYAQRAGEPGVPATKTAAWYYTGSGENPLIGETLTDHSYAESIEVRFYWPVASRDAIPARELEDEVRATTRAFIGLLEGDRSLGENVTDTTIGEAVAGWLDLGGGAHRVVTIPLSLGFTEAEPIAR